MSLLLEFSPDNPVIKHGSWTEERAVHDGHELDARGLIILDCIIDTVVDVDVEAFTARFFLFRR